MSVDWLASHISKLTGLGLEDVKSQVVPYVQSIDTRPKLEKHLQELCGPNPSSQSFIQTYLSVRFPPPPATFSSNSPAPPRPTTKTVQGRSGGVSLVRNALPLASIKGKKSKSSSSPNPSGSGSNTPTASASFDRPDQKTALEEAFGATGGGKVYIKSREDGDVLGWGRAGSGSGRMRDGGATAGGSGNDQSLRASSATTNPRSSSTDPLIDTDRNPTSNLSNEKEKDRARQSAQQAAAVEALKTPQVKKLEKLMARVEAVDVGKERWEEERDAVGMSERDGCFCQARVHPLSTYTPSCFRCGLVLCVLHQPYLPCPSCSTTLLTPSTKARLLTKLSTELNALLARQRKELELAEEEKRKVWMERSGGGAFPTLAGALGGGENVMEGSKRAMRTGVPFVPPAVSRTVISIGPSAGSSSQPTGGKSGGAPAGGKGKSSGTTKIVTYTKASPVPASVTSTSTPTSTSKSAEAKIARPTRPSSNTPDLLRAREADLAWRNEHSRPWGDMNAILGGWEVRYLPPAGKVIDEIREGEGADKGTGKKKKPKGKVGV